jgi:membrane protease YdiL (CAAX protease family)
MRSACSQPLEGGVIVIASRTHTAILAGVFILLAVAGGYAHHAGVLRQAAPSEAQAIQIYATALIVEWAQVYYVWKGTRRRNVPLRSLIGGRWGSPKAVAADVGLAAALWAIWIAIESSLPNTNTVHALLPRTPLEFAVWMLVAVSAGFCEELVFRGYFQRQFHAITGSAAAAVGLQALIFGVGHFYEGTWAVVKITMYGILFGLLALWRKGLRPGMLAHAWSDIFAVL